MDGLFDKENKKPRTLGFSEAKTRISKYCAYQERSHHEVVQKLYSFGITTDQVEEILAWLITENYVNEERYAIAFAGGKFRIKRWGKFKISRHLEKNKVSQYSIDKALSLIDDADYLATIELLIKQKLKNTAAENVYVLRNKVAKYVISKGFEPEQVWDLAKVIIE
jgi:regulatory protein